MKYGLLGAKLGHSYSPQIQRLLGVDGYELSEKSPEELDNFFQGSDFIGLNITIPYKKDALKYCSELTPVAQRLGAVNTIVRREDGSLIGHNTDYFGFETLLLRSRLTVKGKKILVLGTGGAAQTVLAVLQDYGANTVTISRSGDDNYSNLSRHADASIIVNTTPVGMYPNTDTAPLSLDSFPALEGVLDAIYNPACTMLLEQARKRGIVAMNGLLMLVAQAKESAEWFLGKKLDDGKIDEIYRTLRNSMENIVLIGMPGSGKSTVGEILAEKTGKHLVDTDKLAEERAGCSIPEIFTAKGEAAFRALESSVLQELGKESSLIIATGGGCVTRPENKTYLKRNGRIFCLERSLQELSAEGRPISQATDIEKLYRQRKDLYADFADFHIDNNRAPEDASADILSIWEEKS